MVEGNLEDVITARCVATGVERQLGDAILRHQILEAFHEADRLDPLSGAIEQLLEATQEGASPTAAMLEEAALAVVRGEIRHASGLARAKAKNQIGH